MAKHTAISAITKRIVWERDNERCIVCHRYVPITMANSHIIRRSQGGRGIPENICCHCPECHAKYDGYDEATRQATMEYIKIVYPGWQESEVTYHRYTENGSKSEY